jgi:hypothetical protein
MSIFKSIGPTKILFTSDTTVKVGINSFSVPTYVVSSNLNSVDEGSSMTFTLSTTNIANGTVLPYTITGISANDLTSGSLTGNFTVSNNLATVTITASADLLTEGAETAILSLDSISPTVSTSLLINDTSLTPITYAIGRSVSSVNEGSSVTFTLSTTNIANGTVLPYTITGISANDLTSGSLTGNFTVSNNLATVTITASADLLTEGAETAILSLDSISPTVSASIIINDTSTDIAAYTTSLLLNANGTDYSQNNTFLDSSSNNFTITRNGNTTQGSFSPYSVNGGSAYFDGTDDYLSVQPNQQNMVIGTKSFTIEGWVYLDDTAYQQRNWYVNLTQSYQPGDYGIRIGINSSGQPQVRMQQHSGYTLLLQSLSSIAFKTWTHWAVSRSASVVSLYINGDRAATSSAPAAGMALNAKELPLIGSGWRNDSPTLYPWLGYISDVRLVINSAVYNPTASTITVPTSPLTNITNTALLCNFTNAGLIDSARKINLDTLRNARIRANQSKFGGSSIYFDGNKSYLLATDSKLPFGTSNFTIETWLRTSVNGGFGIADSSDTSWPPPDGSILTSSVDSGMWFWGSSVHGDPWSGYWYSLDFGQHTVGNIVSYTWTPLSNTWYHVAVSHSNGTYRLFVNGSKVGETTTTVRNFNSAVNKLIIGGASTFYWFSGHMDDFRVIKDHALYTSNFTPPASELTFT